MRDLSTTIRIKHVNWDKFIKWLYSYEWGQYTGKTLFYAFFDLLDNSEIKLDHFYDEDIEFEFMISVQEISLGLMEICGAPDMAPWS